MLASTQGAISAYLLTTLFIIVRLLLLIGLIACPAVWSRDPARRACARDILLLLGKL
jgi:hypothetical protein